MTLVSIISIKDLEYMDRYAILNSYGTWCQERVDEDYINDLLENKRNYVAVGHRYHGETLAGYAIFGISKNVIHVDLICTMSNLRMGKKIMEEIEKFGRNNSISVVILDSVQQAVEFYKKIGYKIDNEDDEDEKNETIGMYKNIQ